MWFVITVGGAIIIVSISVALLEDVLVLIILTVDSSGGLVDNINIWLHIVDNVY